MHRDYSQIKHRKLKRKLLFYIKHRKLKSIKHRKLKSKTSFVHGNIRIVITIKLEFYWELKNFLKNSFEIILLS